MQAITLPDLNNFTANNEGLINRVKVTKFTQLGFNDMTGYDYVFNVKVETVEGYKNKLITIITNSTYLSDIEELIDDEELSIEDKVKNYFDYYFLV